MTICLLFLIVVVVNALNPNRISSKVCSYLPHHLLQSASSSSSNESSSSLTNSITKITASNEISDQYFGYYRGVAISNNRIVVGASGRGTAYIFGDGNDPEFGRSYSQMAVLTANDGGWLGSSVAMYGDIIVVGAHGNAMGGAAYVYQLFNTTTNSNGSISLLTKLTASNAAEDDKFGISVAIHETAILVGANFNQTI
jgi:hypothetical protein